MPNLNSVDISVAQDYILKDDYTQHSGKKLVLTPMTAAGVGTLPNGYTRTSPLPRIPSTKSRVPHGRQLPGLQNSHPSIAAPICVRAASMA
eukprot:scaffold78340_cov59-Cyclotella_meneghiniana.AAC.5